MTGLQTEFSFTLPKGYVDKQGQLHRRGTMRLATARDEIEPLRDPRVSGSDDPFLTVIVLSRVLTELGSVSQVTPNIIEELFTADLAYLQDFYGIINFGDPADLELLRRATAFEAAGATRPADSFDDGSGPDGSDTSVGPGAGPDGDDVENPTPRGRRAVIEEVKVGS